MDADRMLEAICAGFNVPKKRTRMAVASLACSNGSKPWKTTRGGATGSLERKEHLWIDLADDEVAYPAQPFAPLFKKAKAQGLGITVHAGEPNVPGAPGNILVALDELGADRIGHGVQAIKDDRVVERLARESVVLELCPTSNVLTQAVSSVGEHPIQSLMQRGVRTTINTDDPGVMGLTLMDECMALQTHLGMTSNTFTNATNGRAKRLSFQHPRFNLYGHNLETSCLGLVAFPRVGGMGATPNRWNPH